MEFGDVQIYDTPEKSAWRAHRAWIMLVLAALVALGVYGLYL